VFAFLVFVNSTQAFPLFDPGGFEVGAGQFSPRLQAMKVCNRYGFASVFFTGALQDCVKQKLTARFGPAKKVGAEFWGQNAMRRLGSWLRLVARNEKAY